MRVDLVPPLFQVRPTRPGGVAWTCVSLAAALGLLLAWGVPAGSAAATSPDSAGLVGSSPERPTLPFKLWARSPKSPLKPRRRDLREPELRLKMGDDFDPRWMRTHAYHGPDPPEGPRQSVQKLTALAAREALPDDLSPDARETVRAWLVRRATCPVRYQWGDLGPYFWPRWVRRGQCAADAADGHSAATTPASSAPLPLSDTPFPKSLGNVGAKPETEIGDKEEWETEEEYDDEDDDCDGETCRKTGEQQKNATSVDGKRVSRTTSEVVPRNFSCWNEERNSTSGLELGNSTLLDDDIRACISSWISGLDVRNSTLLDEDSQSCISSCISGPEHSNSTSLDEELISCLSSCIPGEKLQNFSSLDVGKNWTSGLDRSSPTSLDELLVSCVPGGKLRKDSCFLHVGKVLWTSAARNASRGEGTGASGVLGEATVQRPCSWPPGMRCVPSAAKVLQLLRWHCRLRKSALSNSVWVQAADRKKRRRHRFRCQWLKVPYPVAEDCTCA